LTLQATGDVKLETIEASKETFNGAGSRQKERIALSLHCAEVVSEPAALSRLQISNLFLRSCSPFIDLLSESATLKHQARDL
jgi:hypothetical protein